MYQAPTPTYTTQPQVNSTMMSQQIAEFQKQMFDQNQKQMLLLQQQIQSTLESSLKTITDTVAKTLATIPNQVQNQVNTPYPPEIRCTSPAGSERISDFQSAASSIPSLTGTTTDSNKNNQSSEKSTSSAASTSDMMQFVNALLEPKLTFTQLKPSTDYIAWRAMMPLKCTKSSKYSHLVTKNATGGYDFRTDMSIEDSSTLFMLIYDALGQMSEKLIVDVSNPNGHDLLQQLEDYYVDIDTSVVNKQILLQEFDNMKRQQNETYTQFALRFLRKMKELNLNKVTIPRDEATLAYKFLRGLNETRINTEICLDLANKTDWYENMTLTEVAKKAQRYMHQYNSLLKTSSNPGSSKSTNTSNNQKEKKAI